MNHEQVKLMLEENESPFLFVGLSTDGVDTMGAYNHDDMMMMFLAMSKQENLWQYMFSTALLRILTDPDVMEQFILVASSVYGIDLTQESLFKTCQQ